MELVYLWVEEYKNIKRQGFNFSPRFRCEFKDENDKHDLLVEKKENQESEFIDSLLGDNVSLTAVVGKNGTGKSRLVKLIRLILEEFLSDKTSYKGILVFYDRDKGLICLDNEVNCKPNIPIKHISLSDKDEAKRIFEKTIFPILDYSLTYDREIDFYNIRESQNPQFLNFPDKATNSVSFREEANESIKKIFENYQYLSKSNYWGIFENFFRPTHIEVIFHRERFKYFASKNESTNISELGNYLRNKFRNREEVSTEFMSHLYNIINASNGSNLKEEKTKFLELINNDLFEVLCSKNSSHIEIMKKNNISYSAEYKILKLDIASLNIKEVEFLLGLNFRDIFTIEIVDVNHKRFTSLSFGEQQLLKVINILYSLAIQAKIDNIVIFLDEIDIGFHPEWQKNVIKYIIGLTKLLPTKKFNFIILAHSPFVLSDIPSSNVLFLDKWKETIKDVSSEVTINTFASNIHTLLSNGFFMSSLMGEHTKEKITEIIDFLNDKKELKTIKEEHLKGIINNIGEDFLKNKLLSMYYKKYRKDKIEEEREILIQRIEDDQKKLKELDNIQREFNND